MTVRIIHGDARQLPLDDASVDLIVTSPPYWALRSYTDGGEHYDGQIGAEPTPAEYIGDLIACTREWMRVLKPSGSLWVNLGDKYNGSGGTVGQTNANGTGQKQSRRVNAASQGISTKSLMGLPWRYALRCIDDLGLILRQDQIWSKVNGLPESVTDRTRRSHEYFFHLVKEPRYYSAIDHIRTPHSPTWSGSHGANPMKGQQAVRAAGPNSGQRHPLGALPGSVWEVPTEPLQVPAHLGIDHFAAFPMEWPRRIIQGWSPAGICTTCGEGRRPVTDKTNRPLQATYNGTLSRVPGKNRQDCRKGVPQISEVTITGEVCGCPDTSAPTRPAVVLDPFAGTGTTLLVAKALGRDAVGVDMSADYCRLAEWRTQDPGQLAKAMGVPKPPKELDGQASALDLLNELDGGAA